MSEEYEGDYACDMSEDSPCGRPATQVFREPYTPAGFRVYVCDEHAGHCSGFGYSKDREAEKQLAVDRQKEDEYLHNDEMDKQMSEAYRLGESRF